MMQADSPRKAWLAVTYAEWLNWLASGRLRCNHMRLVRGSKLDQPTLFELLDLSPDVNRDDQALLLAELVEEDSQEITKVRRNRQLVYWLPLTAVRTFVPLSERGARLMEADAARARCVLGDPRLVQDNWRHWCKVIERSGADARGRTFVRLLELEKDLPAHVDDGSLYAVLEPCTNSWPESARTRYGGTRATGFAETFIRLSQELGKNTFHPVRDDLRLMLLVERHQASRDLSAQLLENPQDSATLSALQRWLAGTRLNDVPVAAMVVVAHYRDAIARQQDFPLEALVKDVGTVAAAFGGRQAAVCAYHLGLALQDEAISSLEYASRPDAYPTLVVDRNMASAIASFKRWMDEAAATWRQYDSALAGTASSSMESTAVALDSNPTESASSGGAAPDCQASAVTTHDPDDSAPAPAAPPVDATAVPADEAAPGDASAALHEGDSAGFADQLNAPGERTEPEPSALGITAGTSGSSSDQATDAGADFALTADKPRKAQAAPPRRKASKTSKASPAGSEKRSGRSTARKASTSTVCG